MQKMRKELAAGGEALPLLRDTGRMEGRGKSEAVLYELRRRTAARRKILYALRRKDRLGWREDSPGYKEISPYSKKYVFLILLILILACAAGSTVALVTFQFQGQQEEEFIGVTKGKERVDNASDEILFSDLSDTDWEEFEDASAEISYGEAVTLEGYVYYEWQ